MAAFITKSVLGDAYAASITQITKEKSVHEFWRLTSEIRKFANDFDEEVCMRSRIWQHLTDCEVRFGTNTSSMASWHLPRLYLLWNIREDLKLVRVGSDSLSFA